MSTEAITPLADLPKIPTDIAQAIGENEVHLKHVEPTEKNVLPTKEDIAQEKTHQELTEGIEGFAAEKLRSVSTDEKNVLPSAEDIAREKTLDAVEGFDATKLKHVEPHVTTTPGELKF
ncbi:tth-1 [Pristionchus pacificus]|uniref:Tth-1 n=1 Tax=Pristionchus pacificus TaxID=54126 RepID=A0A2A6C571_PRIPA|nr:tth-1 [Pristionchus pacificus]|eukprot:PDM73256.1 tth-1 [Pristionchus pacificus]